MPTYNPNERGYTLVELMIVVAMVGVLATLATYGVRKYILASKTVEGPEMLRSIKEAEELYRQETFTYLPTSTSPGSSYFPWGTTVPTGGKKMNFDCATCTDQSAWNNLNVSTNHPVQFGYEVVTGPVGTAPSAHPKWTIAGFPASPGDIWYVAYATADLDGDGESLVFAGSSFTSEIISNNND
ncbi:MAG: prepilin-type N-terminal cleavage/methylation domain-containing protein [Polyangiaceae bacterium]|nr:prepilin-type N-terminal cleavage/methylation domain-containing protein [Polyangiaceae bacterium]